MNNISKTIGWADLSWNPVIGCKTGCYYCYAKRMNDRFKWIKDWHKPEFFPNRLNEPRKIKSKSIKKIFVCSMAELFGDWIPKSWIQKIINVAKENAPNEFMFLTKNPKRYLEFNFPKNCWLGVTLTTLEDYNKLGWIWRKVRWQYGNKVIQDRPKFFLSIEPLLGSFDMCNLNGIFDMVIVGAITGAGAIKPKQEWIKSIRHWNIFWKKNLTNLDLSIKGSAKDRIHEEEELYKATEKYRKEVNTIELK